MKSKASKMLPSKKSSFPVWLVIVGMPAVFFYWNLVNYTGPAILTDEIGYLVNAIFLSGHHVDGGSSYHVGFSLLLAPLFLLFENTENIWKGAMFINSLLWGGAFYLTSRCITHWDSNMSNGRRAFALLLVSLYPSWMTLSGYVYTSSAFVALFMGGVLSLINAIKRNVGWCYLFTIYVGLLYWVHPTGVMVAGASIIAVGVWIFQNRNLFYLWVIHTAGCLLLIFLYKIIIHPVVMNSMTPEGYVALSHYPNIYGILREMGSGSFWLYLGIHSIGQVSYFLVGSLGVALLGVCSLIRDTTKGRGDTWKGIVGNYLIIAIFGVIIIGAVNFSLIEPSSQRIDHWIYGRYLDNVSIPILTVGVLAFMRMGWRERFSLISPCLLIVILSACSIYMVHSNYPPIQANEIVSTASFWPQNIFPRVNSVGVWLLIGAFAILLVYITGTVGFYLLAPIVFGTVVAHQTSYHKRVLNSYAAPTSIVDIVRENYAPGACVSFDLDSSNGKSLFFRDRISLYKYYLYNYRYQRVAKEGWGADCSDVILTYTPEKYADLGLEVARESHSGLSLMKKKTARDLKISENTPTYGIILKRDGQVGDRITISAEDLIDMSQVGTLVNGSLSSRNKTGYLFFGPYLYLHSNEYGVTIYGEFSQAHSAILDIVGDSGKRVFLRRRLSEGHSNQGQREIAFDFSLPEDTSGLEIRLHVTDQDRIDFTHYLIESK